MTVRARIMEETPPQEELHMIIVGPEGAGKSRLAATGRGVKLFLDFDRRAQSLAGLPNVYTLTFEDTAWPKQPEAFAECLDVVSKLEQSLQLNLIPAFSSLRPDIRVQTVVCDSTYTIAKSARAYALYTSGELRRTINVGGKMEVHVPKSWDGWNVETSMVETMYLRLLAIKGLDVIAIIHETDEERPESTAEKPQFTGGKCVYPVRYHIIQKYFNDIWRVTRINSTKPSIQIIPNLEYKTVKSSFSLEKIEPPNIASAIEEERMRRSAAATANKR